MRKTSLIIALCLVALSIASLTFNINTRTGHASSQKPSLSPKISEAVMYSAFFHFVVDLQRQATEIERGGDKGDSLRAYVQTQASLNDEEARKLDEIAAACVEEVSQQDAKALVVIQAFQSQFPGGKIPAGATPPPPPPELKVLQQERDQIIMNAKSKLVSALGETSFDKVEKFAERRVAVNVQAAPPDKR